MKARVLYIDDETGNRLLVGKILEKAGFEFHQASSALEGLEKARTLKPDLILMDMNLPDMDGYAATTRIKSMPELEQTVVVALTGHSMEGDRERTLAAGCDGYIAKPIQIRELPHQLQAYLKGRKEQLDDAHREHLLRDYSARLVKDLEEKVRELSAINETLEQRVEEKVRELDEARQKLLQSDKMASIGQLAAGVAHEINNPVGFVSANLEQLARDSHSLLKLVRLYERLEKHVPEDDPLLEQVRALKEEVDLRYIQEDLPELLQETRDGLERVRRIVQDLKDFSHAGGQKCEPVDVHKLLDSTLNIVYNELKYKAAIRREYAQLPKIQGMPGKLNQVFMNLLVNAGHAIEDKGTITLRTGTSDDGQQVWIEIIDDGKGMSPEVQKRVFEPFFTTKDIGTGTGLGLSLSYGIIRDHHGQIELESEPGKGTTFRIWLPVNQPCGESDH